MARRDEAGRSVRSESLNIEGRIVSLVAAGDAQSRLELVDATGLSRSTVAERLAVLIAGGVLEESAGPAPMRGRPTRRLNLNKDFALVAAADIGETHAHLALTDLRPAVLAESSASVDIRDGPEAALSWMADEFNRLLRRLGRSRGDLIGVGLGLPAQIDFESGCVVGPSLMVGWEGFDIGGWLGGRMGAPVVVENEVNLMAVSEHHQHWRDVDHMLFVKAGTGVGSGIIADGRLYRGARGAAGEIAHIQVDWADGPLCRCGKLGCVEARASGWALARDLRAQGIAAGNGRDVVALVKANCPQAIQSVREAGRILGKVIADIGCVLNPSAIVIGGTLSQTDDHLMVGLRELLYQRSLPLVTRGLVVETAKAELATCVLLGAAQIVIERRLGVDCVTETLRNRLQVRSPAAPRAPASALT
jgi:predicted NBD/HSP70 family sugar kinase